MDWSNKAHAIDEYVMSCAAREYPGHVITVVNKWGNAVCGLFPTNPIGRLRVVEVKERDWQCFES
jgi:hypothetical protein